MALHPQDRPDSERHPDDAIVINTEEARGGVNANVRYVLIFSLLGTIIALGYAYYRYAGVA